MAQALEVAFAAPRRWHDKKCFLGRSAGWHGRSGRMDPPMPSGSSLLPTGGVSVLEVRPDLLGGRLGTLPEDASVILRGAPRRACA